jgi:hypothetical protein
MLPVVWPLWGVMVVEVLTGLEALAGACVAGREALVEQKKVLCVPKNW